MLLDETSLNQGDSLDFHTFYLATDGKSFGSPNGWGDLKKAHLYIDKEDAIKEADDFSKYWSKVTNRPHKTYVLEVKTTIRKL